MSMETEIDVTEGAEMLLHMKQARLLEVHRTGNNKYIVVNFPAEMTYRVFQKGPSTPMTMILDMRKYVDFYAFKDPYGHSGVLIYNGGDDYLMVSNFVCSFKLYNFISLKKCQTFHMDGNLLIGDRSNYLEFTLKERFSIKFWGSDGEEDNVRSKPSFKLVGL